MKITCGTLYGGKLPGINVFDTGEICEKQYENILPIMREQIEKTKNKMEKNNCKELYDQPCTS